MWLQQFAAIGRSQSRSREEGVIFRWRRFLLLTYLVVTASTAQVCQMTQDEIRERKLREVQETQERLQAAHQEIKRKRRQELQQEAPAHFDTSNSQRMYTAYTSHAYFP